MNEMNIEEITIQIAKLLKIDNTELLKIIRDRLPPEQLELKIQNNNINELFKNDDSINNFEDKILNNKTKNNFNNLKQNIGKLQVLVLIKKLEKANDCNDVINSLLEIFNNKINTVNEILVDNTINQTGGSNIDFYKKYLKYKIKYYILNKYYKKNM